ncbi:MAG: hypothetical protein CO189_05495 [candidate division Zixibacteria bacterium CG_4_9_14_3_um_filter_46_8]|nr:MAG: hypothetical protein CO189_05495 [candidate division Zixibacteria bacterium CG_4_9_14_3_um_filter_46_8]
MQNCGILQNSDQNCRNHGPLMRLGIGELIRNLVAGLLTSSPQTEGLKDRSVELLLVNKPQHYYNYCRRN